MASDESGEARYALTDGFRKELVARFGARLDDNQLVAAYLSTKFDAEHTGPPEPISDLTPEEHYAFLGAMADEDEAIVDAAVERMRQEQIIRQAVTIDPVALRRALDDMETYALVRIPESIPMGPRRDGYALVGPFYGGTTAVAQWAATHVGPPAEIFAVMLPYEVERAPSFGVVHRD